MKRGEIWTSSARSDYAGKPRPVLVLQHEYFALFESVTICGFTTDPSDLPLFRVAIEPTATNGLEEPSRVMADKIMTVRKDKLRRPVGQLSDRDMARVNEAIRVFLGLIG
ncbi:MAG TPA: type II toxin-antitoxin system PemK/MazF family toxin [Pseudolabrys sp.]|nr:type II toxin-antitoxin system PemK/MazF family toxin [Pseudolabrys sp.]